MTVAIGDNIRGEKGKVVGGNGRPKADCGREIISIKALLEWAFATECASLDFDEVGAVAGRGWSSVSTEYRVMQQLSLGKKQGVGVRPDTSIGCSYSHDDAELVATILRNSVRFDLAVRVAEQARACSAPKWDLGQQRIQPRQWSKRNCHGHFGKTEVCQVVKYVSRGRARERKDLWVPCEWVPSASQIGAARRGYLDWWGALLSVSAGLKCVTLDRFALSGHMPPMTPWRIGS